MNPEILFGLGLAAIPVLLHFLMRSKPKPLLFPALRLVQLRRKTNTRRMRLRHIWLLLLRIAVVVLLVLALARPLLPPANYGLSTAESLTLAGIVAVALAAYLAISTRWRRRRMPNHLYAYRRTMLRGGTGAAAFALFLLLVAWPYWQRIRADLTESRPEVFQNVPVAAVFVIDTSPSMEYLQDGESRLQAAQRVGKRFLSELPSQSRVAVADTTGGGQILFQGDMAGARARIDTTKVQPVSLPLDERVRAALAAQEKDAEQTLQGQGDVPADQQRDRYVREVYVFTDMAASQWRQGAATVLRREMERLKRVRVYLIDVGVESPTNAAVTPVRLPEQTISAGGELIVRAGVSSAGLSGEERTIELSAAGPGEDLVKQGTRTVRLNPGAAEEVEFILAGLAGPVVQGEVRIASSDPFSADDVRYFSAAVRQPPKVLIVADRRDDQLDVHDALAPEGLKALGRAPYDVEFLPTTRLVGDVLGRLRQYDVVCLVNASAPADAAWQALDEYVRGGGGLFVAMGDMGGKVEPVQVSYFSEAARGLLPISPTRDGMPTPRDFGDGATLDLPDLAHPVLSFFAELREGAGLLAEQPVYSAWAFAPSDDATVIARYTDGVTPAIVERSHGSGRVLMVTTALDLQGWSELPNAPWQFLVLVDQSMKFLGRQAGGGYNFTAGDAVSVPLDRNRPLGDYLLLKPQLEQLAGKADPAQASVAVREADQVGNYQIRETGSGGRAYTGFAVNLPAGESDFSRVTTEQLDELFGEGRYGIGKGTDDLEKIVADDRIPVEVFPHLLAVVICAFFIEHFAANRFYEAEQEPARA